MRRRSGACRVKAYRWGPDQQLEPTNPASTLESDLSPFEFRGSSCDLFFLIRLLGERDRWEDLVGMRFGGRGGGRILPMLGFGKIGKSD